MSDLLITLSNIMSRVKFNKVCLDSRRVEAGDLFVAMVGEKCDGNDFIADAVAKGAIFVICTKDPGIINVEYLKVECAIEALTLMAQIKRKSFNFPIIALTGSNGKTTVKEMISCILPTPSFSTPGNFNNHLGVPLSILQCNPNSKYAVFELGANHIGEIAHTVSLVKPDVALINNIGPAHIGEFGSIEAIVQGKGEIYSGLSSGGTAIVNDDDYYAHAWDSIVAPHKVIRYSSTHMAPVAAENISFDSLGCARFTLSTPEGKTEIALSVPGKHQVNNALAATACCLAVGIKLDLIKSGLSKFSGVKGRMTQRLGKNDAIILDDTYNANVSSVLSAVDLLAECKGTRILVLGDMGELGEWSEEHHASIGIAARKASIDLVMTCGQYSRATTEKFGTPEHHYTTQDELCKELQTYLQANTTVLVKGSRSAHMENIVNNLCGET